MVIFLETERLFLRQFTEEDVAALAALDDDSQVLCYVNPKNQGQDMILQERIPWLEQVYTGSEGRFGYWAAIEKMSSEFIGWFVLLPPTLKQLKVAELGYRLKSLAWGKGYATEGAKALVQKGFTECGCDLIFAYTRVENKASIRVMEKAGLKFEEYFTDTTVPGVEHPSVKYALLKQEWQEADTVG